MITDEDRAEIIRIAKEEGQKEALRVMEGWLLKLPDLIGSLVMQKTAQKKAVEKLINDHPEFVKYHQLVAGIIQKFDSDNPGTQFEELVKLALPEINKRIEQVKGLNVTSAEKPTRLEFNPSFNGEL